MKNYISVHCTETGIEGLRYKPIIHLDRLNKPEKTKVKTDSSLNTKM